jgi:hypothetical protein
MQPAALQHGDDAEEDDEGGDGGANPAKERRDAFVVGLYKLNPVESAVEFS